MPLNKAKPIRASAARAKIANAKAASAAAPDPIEFDPPSAEKKPAKARVARKVASAEPEAAPAPKVVAPRDRKPARPKPPVAPEPSIQAESKAEGPPSSFIHDLGPLLLTPANREAIETLSMNLARAALTAQGAMAEAALRRADQATTMSRDPFNIAPAISEVMGQLARQPERLMRAQADLFTRYLDLWQSTARRIADGQAVEPVVKPAAGDRRFADHEWQSNPLFDVIKQSYLLQSNWLNDLVSGVEDVEPQTKRRAEFFMKMLTDAFSPSNFLISNPAALREVVETRGESLVRGMQNFAADLERGGGSLQITQTDVTKFQVGVNVATAPGKVVFQNELLQLLQFTPTTDTVFDIPLLIFPPWINKYYILDLRPENSMIRWLTGQGFTVFVVSWVNPDGSLADKTFQDYMLDGIQAAVGAVLKQTGAKTVNAVGYCIAGTLLSCTLAYMAAKKDARISSATFFAAQQDFSESGDLRLFTDEDWLRTIEISMDNAGGFLPGRVMSDTFNALRANDLVWSFFISNYLLGKEPKSFDLLFWNSDQTRMPKALHMEYLRRFYQENALSKGQLELGGVKLDLKTVKTPIYAMASKEDHIAPYPSVYRGTQLFGGPVTFTLSGSGHIAGVINAPVAAKYQTWTNSQLPPTADEWLAEATATPGSWWPHWVAWLRERSGEQAPARDPANGPLTPIEDAPGSFVKVKS
jgi:polyhydroxyalkanoate synthase